MRTVSTLLIVSTTAFFAVVTSLAIVAGTSMASGGGSASASAPASAPAPASANAPPRAPHVSGKDVPATPSDAPKPGDWKDAQTVSANRGEMLGCRLMLLHGWLRAECTNFYGVTLAAGDPHDVHTLVSGTPFAWDMKTQTQSSSLAVIELPLAAGRSYIATFIKAGEGDYGPAFPVEGPTLHVAWEPGEADPTLIFIDHSP